MSDKELQLALAKMLPEKLRVVPHQWPKPDFHVRWDKGPSIHDLSCIPVLDTEWLHVCWLSERELRYKSDQFQWLEYSRTLFEVIWNRSPNSEDCVCDALAWYVMNASWQQRAEALCKFKGIVP